FVFFSSLGMTSICISLILFPVSFCSVEQFGADMDELQRARGRNKVKKGLTFTLMVVGSSGTGNTTFVNTLCAKPVLEHKEADDPEHAHVEHGVRIKPVTVGTSFPVHCEFCG